MQIEQEAAMHSIQFTFFDDPVTFSYCQDHGYLFDVLYVDNDKKGSFPIDGMAQAKAFRIGNESSFFISVTSMLDLLHRNSSLKPDLIYFSVKSIL